MQGERLRRDDRGAQEVIGMTALLGLTVVAGVLLLYSGQSAVEEARTESQIQLAEETLSKMQAAFETFSEESTLSRRTVEIPSGLRGELSVDRGARWKLQLNDNQNCSSGSRALRTVRYNHSGETVAFQGGGVWRRDFEQNSRGRLVSPPSVSVSNSTLNVRFPKIDGNVTDTGELRLVNNRTAGGQFAYRLRAALTTNKTFEEVGPGTAPPGGGPVVFNRICQNRHSATLHINGSVFADAWATWAQANYDRRATVRPIDPAPGENVSIRFDLGDVTPSDIRARELSFSRTDPDDPMTVTVDVVNGGGLNWQGPVNVSFVDVGTGETFRTAQRVSLNESEPPKTLAFDIPDSEIRTGSFEIRIQTPNETAGRSVTIDDADAVETLSIESLSVPDDVTVGSVTNGTTTIRNTGDITVDRTVNVTFDTGATVSEPVTLDPGETTTVDFQLRTRNKGPRTVAVRAKTDTETTTYTVGTGWRYGVSSVSSPPNATGGTAFTISGTVKNAGVLTGEGDVRVRVQNISTGTIVDQAVESDLRLAAAEVETVSLSTTVSAGAAGLYNYTVETPNETVSNTFAVGTPDTSTFVVSNATIYERPLFVGNSSNVDVTVTNTGSAPGKQTVSARLIRQDNSSASVPGVVDVGAFTPALDPGERRNVTLSRPLTGTAVADGRYNLVVTTDNVTVRNPVQVLPADAGLAETASTISIDTNITARVTAIGTELEGLWASDLLDDPVPYDDPYYQSINAPVEMSLFVRNDTGEHRIPLWRDEPHGGDVNHPRAEAQMVFDNLENDYTRTVTLDPGDEVSVFAKSYFAVDASECTQTDVVWRPGFTYTGTPYDMRGLYCDRDGERISIDSSNNPSNLVVLADGDEVPAFNQAGIGQRGLNDILGGRIDDDGELNLADDEVVLLYELSEPNADPDSASGSGDPDYNDAVVLFEVVENQKTVRTDADFRISGIDARTRVDNPLNTSERSVAVTVQNTGGRTNSTDVQFGLDGTVRDTRSLTVPGNSSRTVTFDQALPGDLSSGTHELTATLTHPTGDSRSRFISAGSTAAPNFLITGTTAPSVSDVDDNATLNATVQNTGNTDGTQTVALRAGGTVADSASLTLRSGERKTVGLNIPDGSAPANTTVTYAVNTSNVSVADGLFEGNSVVGVDRVTVNTVDYGANDTIEVQKLEEMEVAVENRGTVGDSREVRLAVTNTSNGNTVFDRTKPVSLGNGRVNGTVPGFLDFDLSGLDMGYYDYTVRVYNETEAGGTVEETWEGTLFYQADSTSESNDGSGGSEGSGVGTGSSVITVG